MLYIGRAHGRAGARADALPPAGNNNSIYHVIHYFNNSNKTHAPGDRMRPDLIRAVFLACDRDRDGKLDVSEMQLFAESTGFNGSDGSGRERPGIEKSTVFN